MKLKVVRPAGYPARFNTPRPDYSRHRIVTRQWLPLHKAWQPLEVALVMSAPDADLIASFNRIPLGRTPYTISFESHLPRLFTYEESAAFRHFTRRLASERCRRIIPISQFARRMFLHQHADGANSGVLEEKADRVIYPAVDVPDACDLPDPDSREPMQPLRVFFAGHHFSRKGGPALLLAAQEAARARLPIEFHIVSNLTVGAGNGVWTDPSDPSFFAEALRLMDLPNIVHHGSLPNDRVMALLRTCDVSLLPTLSDTFGYSVIESLGCGIPVIATTTCALPELVRDGETGHLLHLETDGKGEWSYLFRMDRDTPRYSRVLTETMQDLSVQILDCLRPLVDDPLRLGAMKRAAHEDACLRFDARRQSEGLDDLYDTALGRVEHEPGEMP